MQCLSVSSQRNNHFFSIISVLSLFYLGPLAKEATIALNSLPCISYNAVLIYRASILVSPTQQTLNLSQYPNTLVLLMRLRESWPHLHSVQYELNNSLLNELHLLNFMLTSLLISQFPTSVKIFSFIRYCWQSV